MKAYIQTQGNGEWLNENCYTSAQTLHRMGYDIGKFTLESIDSLVIEEADVVHGGILGVRTVLNKLRCQQPEIHNPHQHLLEFTYRAFFKETTFGEIVNTYSQENPVPTFIKPLVDHKLFTGLVVDSYSSLIKLTHIPRETKILQSSVETFVSEYRCFILRDMLIGSKNYSGSFKVIPDFDIVERAIKAYKHRPVAYTLDFGITDEGDTKLIEINDAFGLGAYGLNPVLYCKMIIARWHEMKKQK